MSNSVTIDKQVLEAIKAAPARVMARLALAVLMYSDDEAYTPEKAVSYEFGLLKPMLDRRRHLSAVRRGAAEARWKRGFASDLHMQNECKPNANCMQTECKTDANFMQNVAKFQEILTKPTDLELEAKKESSKERNYTEKKTPSIEGVKEKSLSPSPSDPFPHISSPFPSEQMKRYLAWVKKKCPYIARNLRQPDERELAELKDEFGDPLSEILIEIENHKSFREEKSDVVGAVKSWTRKEYSTFKSRYEGN